MFKITTILLLSFFITSCNKKEDITINPHRIPPPPPPKEKIYWIANKSKVEINNSLSHQKGFECDSVIGVDYVGFEGEHFFYPINQKGEIISSVKKKQKLTTEQFSRLNSILGDKKTYEHPQIVGCYEPRLGFIYFKENKIIGQTQICLSCAQLFSTAKTVGKEYGNSINDEAIRKIDKLRVELGFSNTYN